MKMLANKRHSSTLTNNSNTLLEVKGEEDLRGISVYCTGLSVA